MSRSAQPTSQQRGEPQLQGGEGARSEANSAEARLARFAGALQRDELDAALALWAQLPASAQEPAWRAFVARWLQVKPGDAPRLAEAARTARSDDAFSAVIAAWSQLSDTASSASLVSYAQHLPLGAARTIALESAVRSGTERDPAAVAAWLPALREADELDFAAAHLVAHTDTLFRPTSQALEWAALIRDPARRAETLALVVREWSGRDRAAATAYVAESENFSSEQRTALLASLTPRPDPQ